MLPDAGYLRVGSLAKKFEANAFLERNINCQRGGENRFFADCAMRLRGNEAAGLTMPGVWGSQVGMWELCHGWGLFLPSLKLQSVYTHAVCLFLRAIVLASHSPSRPPLQPLNSRLLGTYGSLRMDH